MKHAAWLITLVLLLAGAVVSHAQAPAVALETLIEDEWEWRLRENPLFATSVGDHSANDRLPSVALADYQRRRSSG